MLYTKCILQWDTWTECNVYGPELAKEGKQVLGVLGTWFGCAALPRSGSKSRKRTILISLHVAHPFWSDAKPAQSSEGNVVSLSPAFYHSNPFWMNWCHLYKNTTVENKHFPALSRVLLRTDSWPGMTLPFLPTVRRAGESIPGPSPSALGRDILDQITTCPGASVRAGCVVVPSGRDIPTPRGKSPRLRSIHISSPESLPPLWSDNQE